MEVNIYEVNFRDAYERAFGVRPVFNLDHLTDAELLERTKQISNAQLTRQLG